MGTIVSKTKGKNGKQYWYYVESGRVDGQPRIVRQDYLGTAEKVAATMKNGTRPVPLSATARAWGLPGALWLAARDSGLWECLLQAWPAPRSGPGIAHYMLLAAIQRVCNPGPKAAIGPWYEKTVLKSIWGFAASRFSSQAFWDAFSKIDQDSAFPRDDLTQLQIALARIWAQGGLVTDTVVAYDTTNFYTYIDSKNERCELAQRGHNKQGRHNLRQVGLAYAMDGNSGMGLFHHTYPGNRADAEEFGVSLPRMLEVLTGGGISPSAVTLVFDKGASSLLNSVDLEDSGLGWISALPWSQAPKDMRELPTEQMQCCSSALPGIRVKKGETLVHGRPSTCVVLHSSVFQSEQLHSLMANVAKACSKLRALAHALTKSRQKSARSTVEKKIAAILAAQWLNMLITTELNGSKEQGWSLQFNVDNTALTDFLTHRLGKTFLATNRADWPAEKLASAYHGQAAIERQFRSMKEGEGSSWGPMFAWTDSKIRVHSFYCMLGLSLVNWLHRRARDASIDMSEEHMLEQLDGLQEIVLVYPSSTSGPKPTAKVDTRESLDQIQLIKTLGLDRLRERHQG